MKYVLLAYRDEERWNAMSTNEHDALENACLAYEQDLEQSDHLFAVDGLKSSRDAITVQFVDGQVSLTQGLFAEAPGKLIRLFFINARDLNEAIQAAAKMPQARIGPVEVRPIMETGKM